MCRSQSHFKLVMTSQNSIKAVMMIIMIRIMNSIVNVRLTIKITKQKKAISYLMIHSQDRLLNGVMILLSMLNYQPTHKQTKLKLLFRTLTKRNALESFQLMHLI